MATRSTDTPKAARRDELFSAPLGNIAGFTFDEQVVRVFPDMLDRSIPGYNSIIAQSGLLAGRYARSGTCVYDMGASLGATALAMQSNIARRDIRLVAIDNSEPMISELNSLLAQQPGNADGPRIETTCADLREVPVVNASVVAFNFTLQFIEPQDRQRLLDSVYAGMVSNSVLILSEKVVVEDEALNSLYIEMYHAFKRANGYSDLEISQKRTALENVLIPDTISTHEARLKQAGFDSVAVWFQCFNFMSLIALKH